jgi:hypothetical protein
LQNGHFKNVQKPFSAIRPGLKFSPFFFKYINMLYHIVYFIHVMLISFILIGFLLPKKYLIYYLFSWPILLIDWHLNDHTCIISQIENKLRKRKPTPNVYQFFSLVLNKYGINVSYKTTKKIVVCGLSIGWLIAFIRYVW